MRVYGTSPLYNYVELVFRSKKLFIVSILLATVITAVVATRKAGSYTSTALVLLSGTPQAAGAGDEASRGTIQFKLNVLDLVLKDPNFMKEALQGAGLDKGRSTEDFEKFVKDARGALKPAVGKNVMELSIRWPNAECVNILNAFYDLYSRRVLDQETVVSQTQTRLTRKMLDEYTDKVKDMEKKVIAMKQSMVDDPVQDFAAAQSAYQEAQKNVKAYEAQGQLLSKAIAQGEVILSKTPKMIIVRSVQQAAQANVEYQMLTARKVTLEGEKADLLTKYSENHPTVKAKQGLIDQVQASIDRLDKPTPKDKTQAEGRLSQRTTEPNPLYMNIEQRLADYKVAEQENVARLATARQAEAAARTKAKAAPNKQYAYRWMLDKQGLYSNIRENLVAKLEQALIEEKREREMHIAEMTMMVKPEAEQEIVGSKSLIFFAAGPILGLIVAFAFSLLTETLDHSLRTPVEVEKFLGKPVLAVLPRMDGPKDKTSRRLGTAGGGSAGYLPPS